VNPCELAPFELLIRGFGFESPGGAPVLTWGFSTLDGLVAGNDASPGSLRSTTWLLVRDQGPGSGQGVGVVLAQDAAHPAKGILGQSGGTVGHGDGKCWARRADAAVRFWEQNGSGEARSGGLRRGDH
jgi:hypothetical protein